MLSLARAYNLDTWTTIQYLAIADGRFAYKRQVLKRPGKGGRTEKITMFYVGADSYAEARAIATQFRKYTIVRKPKYIHDFEWEVAVGADFSFEEIEKTVKTLTYTLPQPKTTGVFAVRQEQPYQERRNQSHIEQMRRRATFC